MSLYLALMFMFCLGTQTPFLLLPKLNQASVIPSHDHASHPHGQHSDPAITIPTATASCWGLPYHLQTTHLQAPALLLF